VQNSPKRRVLLHVVGVVTEGIHGVDKFTHDFEGLRKFRPAEL
jgi:hypothetical protein